MIQIGGPQHRRLLGIELSWSLSAETIIFHQWDFKTINQ